MNKLRKLTCLLLALMMVFALAATASAAGDTSTITAPAGSTRTYEVYQIFTGDLDPESKVLSNVKWGQNGTGTAGELVDEATLNALTAVNGKSDTEKMAAIEACVDLTSGKFGEVKDGAPLSVPNGYYLIKDVGPVDATAGEAYGRYVVKIVGDTTIVPKVSDVSFQKKVKDTNDTSYQFGKNMDQTYGTTAIDEYAVDVTWEIADKTNIGLDMRLLNNKFNLQFDAFKESRKGIYLRRTSIPSYFGMINNPYGNIGKVENKGIEMSVSYANSWRDWSLSVMGNYSFNRNKVLEDDSTVAYPWQKTIGNKVDQRFGLIALGLFESPEEIAAAPVQVGDTRPGDIRYKDINGDGKIDEYDKVPIGWGSVPEIVYGFGFSVGWKGLSLSAMFQGAAHVDAILSGEGVLPFAQGSSRGNLLSNITDRWTEANPRQDVFYPRLSIGNMNMNYEASTWWLKNTSYLRLKNIELSYTLPDRWMKRIHINNARIFIQGVNLLTFSKFKLWDVELGDGRGAKYPNIGSVSLGINFNF